MRGFFYLVMASMTINPGKANSAKTTTAIEIISAIESHLVLCDIIPQTAFRFYPKFCQLMLSLNNQRLALQLH